MTVEQQLDKYGLAAVAIAGKIRILTSPPGVKGNVIATLDTDQFRGFLFNAAHELYVAEARPAPKP